MRSWSTFLIGAGLLAAGAASAADLSARRNQPVAPAFDPVIGFNWTGGYIGAEAGYDWSRVRLGLPGVPASASVEPDGFTLGGHAGYRYQLANNLVLGAEVRGFTTFDNDATTNYGGLANRTRFENQWGGDGRLTLGYAFGRFLPYLAGGVAIADYKGSTTVLGGAPGFSETRAGYTIGGGLAYALTDNIVTRIDYSYSDFGAKNESTPGVPGNITRVRLDSHALRAGLSYKF